MKRKVFMVCLTSIITIGLGGCGFNTIQDDDYAEYSLESQDTSTTVNTTIDADTVTEDETLDTTSIEDSTNESSFDTTSIASEEVTTTEEVTQQQVQDSSIQELSESNNSDGSSANEQPSVTVAEQPSFDESDMYFTASNGYTFTVNMNVEEVVSNLGDNYILENVPSCYYDGNDINYIYDDFSIYTYTLDGSNYYSQEIEVTTDTLSTGKGINNGSSLEDVEETYGTNYQVFGNEYRFYATDDTYLYFFVFNGIVNAWGYRIDIE